MTQVRIRLVAKHELAYNYLDPQDIFSAATKISTGNVTVVKLLED